MPWIQLRHSIKNIPVRRYIPDAIASFKDVFHFESILHNRPFWDLISQVINVPYEDLPLDDSMCSYSDLTTGTHVYRCNHDVAHSVRKLTYIIQLLDLVQKHASSHTKHYLERMTVQETNLLYLLVFLERAGRTNEYSSNDDPTILQRSAEIFYHIAREQLHVPEHLVYDFCTILEGTPSEHHKHHVARALFFTGPEPYRSEMRRFLHRCLVTSHHMDLLRCRKTSDVAHWLLNDLGAIFSDDQCILRPLRDELIRFSKSALIETGTQYDPVTGQIHHDLSFRKVAVLACPSLMIEQLLTPQASIDDSQLAIDEQSHHLTNGLYFTA